MLRLRSRVAIALVLAGVLAACRAESAPPTRAPELLVPTAQSAALPPTTPSPVAFRAPASLPAVRSAESWRFGVGLPLSADAASWLGALGAGWYMNWRVIPKYRPAEGIEFWQTVRVSAEGIRPPLEVVIATARRRPGSVWIIGNEPDVRWQDNVTPEEYAAAYFELHSHVKQADPTARLVAGNVSQATPLRLAYLDRVLEAYRRAHGVPMPVDVWGAHAYVLREERASWGVDIPPGMSADSGMLYEIADHADRQIFQGQIVAFRRWMAERGYRDVPLVVSEYGILMPASYGFPPEAVEGFMRDSFDYFLSATDPDFGHPQDSGRLVQRWAWYSLADVVYPTGNLADGEGGGLTPLGLAYRSYVESLSVDLPAPNESLPADRR